MAWLVVYGVGEWYYGGKETLGLLGVVEEVGR